MPRFSLKDKAIDFWYNRNVKPKVDELGIDEVRYRLYRNISPYGYIEARNRIKSALDNKLPKLETFNYEHGKSNFTPERDDIFATYLQIPKEKRRNFIEHEVSESEYKPTNSKDNIKYHKIKLGWYDKRHLVNAAIQNYDDISDYSIKKGYNLGLFVNKSKLKDEKKSPLKIGENRVSRILATYFGDHTIGRGIDPNKGDYVSYYDLWDLAPISGNGKDESRGIGKPIEFYDRIYLDDYFNVDTKPKKGDYYGGYLPQVDIYKQGGRISLETI